MIAAASRGQWHLPLASLAAVCQLSTVTNDNERSVLVRRAHASPLRKETGGLLPARGISCDVALLPRRAQISRQNRRIPEAAFSRLCISPIADAPASKGLPERLRRQPAGRAGPGNVRATVGGHPARAGNGPGGPPGAADFHRQSGADQIRSVARTGRLG